MSIGLRIECNAMVPMRDGVRLGADIYRPDDDDVHPVLVHRAPYDKSNGLSTAGRILNPLVAAQHGYVVVVQDTRGRYQSEGSWTPFFDEAADGYDTVEWAAIQPWSTGAVGIYGSSYNGVTTLQATVANPPHLKAAFAYLAGANYHNGWMYSGGTFELGFNLHWASGSLGWETLNRLKLDPTDRRQLAQRLADIATDRQRAARQLPLYDMPAFQDGVAPYWRQWLDHPTYDEYWRAVDVAARATDIKVPLLHISGWYDNFLRGHLDLNEQLQRHPDDRVRLNHRLIIGPWDHGAYIVGRPTTAGDRDFGPDAVGGPALTTNLVFQWFDHWLTGKETALFDSPRVRYYLMGENAWREAESWPPPYQPVAYYLHGQGRANSRLGDGVLATDAPLAEPPDSYRYDPNNPVPTAGGNVFHPEWGPGGIQDQTRVEEREDVLVYTSPRLTSPVSVTGPVTATLFAASSAPDTDFTAKLVDVEPNGYCAILADGIIRARYRSGTTREEFLQPGEVVEYTIDLWHVAHTFLPGHRIRLEISSSNFPRFDRNANSRVNPARATAEDLRVAVQQVFHDADRPSCVVLPMAMEV